MVRDSVVIFSMVSALFDDESTIKISQCKPDQSAWFLNGYPSAVKPSVNSLRLISPIVLHFNFHAIPNVAPPAGSTPMAYPSTKLVSQRCDGCNGIMRTVKNDANFSSYITSLSFSVAIS
jgi:hypothetical protein